MWLAAANVGAARLKLGSGFDLANNLIVAAGAGMGVAVVQPCLVERELATGELVQSFELNVSTGLGYYLCTRKAAEGNPVVEVFTRWIVEMAKASTRQKRGVAGPAPAGARTSSRSQAAMMRPLLRVFGRCCRGDRHRV